MTKSAKMLSLPVVERPLLDLVDRVGGLAVPRNKLPPSAFPWARIRCSGDIQAFSMLLGIEYAET